MTEAAIETGQNRDATVTTIDAEGFRNVTFFVLSLPSVSFTRKVKDPAKAAAYFGQLEAEIEAAKHGGGEPDLSRVALLAGSGTPPKNAKVAARSTKTLFYSPALEELAAHLAEMKARVCGPPERGGLASPSHIIEGLFCVPDPVRPQVNDIITEAKRRMTEEFTVPGDNGATVTRPGYLTALLADYPAAIERAKTAPLLEGGLGPLWEESDYPSAAQLRQRFQIKKCWLKFGVPEGLPPELREEAVNELRSATDEIKEGLRVTFAELLQHMKEKLEVKPGAKAPVFRDSLVGNVIQFCESFGAHNWQNDQALANLVEEAKQVVSGMDPDKLRKYASVRANAAEQVAAIAAKMDGMITLKRGRVVDLSDD